MTKYEADGFHFNSVGFLCEDYDDLQALKGTIEDKVLHEMEHRRPREQVMAEILAWGRPFDCLFDRWEFTIEVW